jgi:predicted dehydrogenase
LGSIGRRHLRNLLSLGEKDIILYRTGKSSLPEDELGSFTQETSLHQALDKYNPAAVIVSNPTSMHLDVAIPAAERGCSILLEKPPSDKPEKLEQLRSIVANRGAKLLMGFQFRFHPGVKKARQLLSDGQIGRIVSADVTFGEYLPGWHPWEDYRDSYAARADLGGGVVLTQCHALDYLPWLVGEVQSVWAFTAKASDLEVSAEDTAKVGLRFACGALGSIHLDYNRQPPEHHFEIIGTQGSLTWNLSDGATRIYRTVEARWEEFSIDPKWERNTMFLDEMKHFLEVVKGIEKPSCTLEDGIKVQRLIQAIHDSNNKNQAVSFNKP